MSNVPDKELKQNMHSILTRAQSERIVISQHGRPSVVLVGIEDYDAEDLRLARSEDFWRMIRVRRASGKSLSLEEVENRNHIFLVVGGDSLTLVKKATHRVAPG
jgi:prevent-host-death family protein